MRFLVQASSVSWSGDKDDCMVPVEGKPVIHWTIKRIYDNFEGAEVRVISPAFDEGGALQDLKDDFPALKITYSHDDNPLARMIDATSDMDEDDCFFRTDGLNLFFDTEAVSDEISLMKKKEGDCVKFPDDYPVHYASELYRVGAVRSLAEDIDAMEASGTDEGRASFYRIHPRYLFFRLDKYKAFYIEGNLPYPDDFMKRSREVGHMVLQIPRKHLIENKSISAGDQLGYHYDLALEWINDGDRVLDIASGDGYGTDIVAREGITITGADLDEEVIEAARSLRPDRDNMNFEVQDVLNLTYGDGTFDVVLSMETIEHIPDEDGYLIELRRVLKPGGLLIISTPQNSFGAVPFNGIHIKEYSLKELTDLISRYLKIEKVIGFKGGRVYFDDDPIGTNSFIISRKES